MLLTTRPSGTLAGLKSASDPTKTNDLQVPILVSSDPAAASDLIIAYNVFEAIINRNEGENKDGRKLAHKVSKAFTITVKTAHNVVKLMQNSGQTQRLA